MEGGGLSNVPHGTFPEGKGGGLWPTRGVPFDEDAAILDPLVSEGGRVEGVAPIRELFLVQRTPSRSTYFLSDNVYTFDGDEVSDRVSPRLNGRSASNAILPVERASGSGSGGGSGGGGVSHT